VTTRPTSDSEADTLAYQNLGPDDVIASVEALGYFADGRQLALNSYENRVYRIGIEDDLPIVAKFYRPGRWTDEQILEEHAFSAELADEEIPVVPPTSHNGSTLHRYGNFRVAVYPCHGGRSPDLDDLELTRQLGRLVARIHLVGADRSYLHRPALDLENFGIASRDFLIASDFLPEELAEIYSDICDLLFDGIRACYERAGPARSLRLHGDFYPSNVLVNRDVLHIVDLDDSRTGPAVQDLWMFLSGDREEQTPQLEVLLDGYTEFRNFDARELNLVEALRTLRMLHYAAWLARRWDDPAFKRAFPWFGTRRYWDDHVLALREQVALMYEPPITWRL
jgi:Ser/Thr protein kinase RdoA (MazF antagonist)